MTDHTITRDAIAKAAKAAKYTADERDALLWLYNYWIDQLYADGDALADLLGYDWTVITRVWRGKYPGSIAAVVNRIRGLRRRIESGGFDRFVATQVTGRIISHLDSLLERPGIGMVVGPTGRSKTHTLRTWARAQTPGRVIMVEAPPYGGTKACLETIAAKLHLPKNRPTWQQRQAISGRITAETIIIIDEAVRLLSARSVQTLEVLRSLHDEQGASLVFCLTRLGASQIETGPQSGYLEQLVGRTLWTVDIPEDVTNQEARAVADHYFPGDNHAPADLVSRVQTLANAGNAAGMSEMGRLRIAFAMLDAAAGLAEKRQETLTAKHLEAAIRHRRNQAVWQK